MMLVLSCLYDELHGNIGKLVVRGLVGGMGWGGLYPEILRLGIVLLQIACFANVRP